MAIRVTQHTMYNDMVGKMQKNLSGYMESVEQGSSQKKINRPSDDPAGTYRVLTTRVDISNTTQYRENVDTAKGWLNLADDVLSKQVATVMTDLKALAEQASTGTYNASQRQIMADQARQYFGQLLNLSNTEFEGKSIFAGHRYDKNAFEEGLAITTWDKNWDAMVNNGNGLPDNNKITIEGASETTVLVEFVTDEAGATEPLQEGTKYRWSNDSGATWQAGTVSTDEKGNFVLRPEGSGVVVTIPNQFCQLDENGELIRDADGQLIPSDEVLITGKHSSESTGANNGTMLYIRPGAFYQGDDKDPPVDITVMGNEAFKKGVEVSAEGSFGKNVLVRIDGQLPKDADGNLQPVDLKGNEDFYWSYSTDGGNNWITSRGKPTGADALKLPIPGGYMDIDVSGLADKKLPTGTQIMVHPSRADLDYEIMKDTYLSVNSVGKEVFGGYYEGKPALSGENNLFEVVGAFIGYLEGNNQEGCQRTLAALTKAEQQILGEATRIGGMENRLELASDVLSFQAIDQQERLSFVEDIDLTELLTRLTRQQLTYQTVLQSSSMIMQLSLANYI